jgi:hypothetical protein
MYWQIQAGFRRLVLYPFELRAQGQNAFSIGSFCSNRKIFTGIGEAWNRAENHTGRCASLGLEAA